MVTFNFTSSWAPACGWGIHEHQHSHTPFESTSLYMCRIIVHQPLPVLGVFFECYKGLNVKWGTETSGLKKEVLFGIQVPKGRFKNSCQSTNSISKPMLHVIYAEKRVSNEHTLLNLFDL